MTRTFPLKTLITASIATTFLASSLASAAMTEQGNSWTAADTSLANTGESFTANREDLSVAGELVYTTNNTEPGMLFSCQNNKLRAAISLTPQNWEEAMQKSSRRSKTRDVKMTLDGGETVSLGKFVFKPTLQTLTARNRKQAVRLYNAAIKGQDITISMAAKNSVTISLPKPNQMFADFGGQCGIGKYKKK
ncbi:MAG: hypothetical protein COA69_02340 [Robiginitomaculum sp.]|nr:MAG: hypothetical protein COA69_02340 [Robiginitomaculum sp.]